MVKDNTEGTCHEISGVDMFIPSLPLSPSPPSFPLTVPRLGLASLRWAFLGKGPGKWEAGHVPSL